MANAWNYKGYKELKIKLRLKDAENELLKLKLNDCEQRRAERSNKSVPE